MNRFQWLAGLILVPMLSPAANGGLFSCFRSHDEERCCCCYYVVCATPTTEEPEPEEEGQSDPGDDVGDPGTDELDFTEIDNSLERIRVHLNEMLAAGRERAENWNSIQELPEWVEGETASEATDSDEGLIE